jgi:hypothetical protein
VQTAFHNHRPRHCNLDVFDKATKRSGASAPSETTRSRLPCNGLPISDSFPGTFNFIVGQKSVKRKEFLEQVSIKEGDNNRAVVSENNDVYLP